MNADARSVCSSYQCSPTFQLTVIIAAVFTRRCRRTARSAATYRAFVNVLITLFTTDHHDAKLQKTNACDEFYCL